MAAQASFAREQSVSADRTKEHCMQRRVRGLGPFFVVIFSFASIAAAWQPAEGPLKTRWTKDVTPENVLPEYPRPQMVREEWTNLNGLWSYAIRPASEA